MSLTKVAVYGTLKQGHGNHRLLTDSKFLGKASVKGRMYHLGGFPGVRLDEPGTVQVELYEVDNDTLRRLDRLEGYREGAADNNFYTREIVETDTEEHVSIYQISKDYTSDKRIIASGDWS